MPETILDLNTPLVRVLACVALNPGLRSVLFRDISPTRLIEVADILVSMLEVIAKCKIKLVVLGASHTEDDLWGYNTLRVIETHEQKTKHCESQLEVCWQPGLLDHRSHTPDQPDVLCLVLIPDLSQISLAAARACVALNNVEIAHLERHGRQDTWCPDICWLAGYSGTSTGSVTRHLLDRFALRLRFAEPVLDFVERTNLLRSWHQNMEAWIKRGHVSAETILPLSAELRECLQRAGERWVAPNDESLLDVLADRLMVASLRHAIGMARLSYTLARLDGDAFAIQFDQAAQLIDLDGWRAASDVTSNPSMHPPVTNPPAAMNPDSQQSSPPVPPPEHKHGSTTAEQPIAESSLHQRYHKLLIWPAVPIRLPDQALRSPGQVRVNNTGSGETIGVEQAAATDRLAIIPTLIEAARFTPWRRTQRYAIEQLVDTRGLIVMPLDLRGYRRSRTRQVLLLVIDYTCLDQANWEQILADHLNWSYRTHTDILVIQVGVGADEHAFRAHMVNVRSPLASRVQAALTEQPGQATPLAHGLHLALQVLDRELRHRRGAARSIHLIIASDGRGNVRLVDSNDQQIRRPIKDEGFTDALDVAQRLCELQRKSSQLTITFLDPQPQAYRDLPLKLAAALGAELVKILAPI
jgi:magnesium chelatase subunit D